MSQNLNDRPDRSAPLIIGHVGHCGNSAIMKQMLALGIMEAMKSPGGLILVGPEPEELDIARGQSPTILHIDEFPFYLEREHPQYGRRVIDEQGPWPPVPVDDVPHYYSKESQERLAKAEAKRQRKNLKRLKDAGRV